MCFCRTCVEFYDEPRTSCNLKYLLKINLYYETLDAITSLLKKVNKKCGPHYNFIKPEAVAVTLKIYFNSFEATEFCMKLMQQPFLNEIVTCMRQSHFH